MRWNVAGYQDKVFQRLGLTVRQADRVLDLGCGVGNDTERLARTAQRTVGIDLVEHPRWKELTGRGLEFIRADAEALPFPDCSFDLVFVKDVLHHAAAPERVLLEAGRVCAGSGRLIILEGNRFNPLLYLHMTLMLGHQHFPRARFQRLVRRHFPRARFLFFEAHVYPFKSGLLMGLARLAETAVERAPLVSRLASYNAAVVDL